MFHRFVIIILVCFQIFTNDFTHKIEKYTMSEEDYNKRDGTYRKFKESQKAQNPQPGNYLG